MLRGRPILPAGPAPTTEHPRDRATDICPVDSECARRAIAKVQAYWRRTERVPMSLKKRRFVEADE